VWVWVDGENVYLSSCEAAQTHELQRWLAKTDKVRALFVGKAGSKEQVHAFLFCVVGVIPR
jgi:hypothetical protein